MTQSKERDWLEIDGPDTPLDTPDRIRSAGLRITAPRLAVLAALPDGAHFWGTCPACADATATDERSGV